jgi:hypothetical protein
MVGGDLSDLVRRLKDAYRSASEDRGPSEEEIRNAFGTLIGAWDKVAEAVSAALTDPEVRARLKEAASSFAAALGATITDLGEKLKGTREPTSTEEE